MSRQFYILVTLSVLLLSACGQSGPLYLPEPKKTILITPPPATSGTTADVSTTSIPT